MWSNPDINAKRAIVYVSVRQVSRATKSDYKIYNDSMFGQYPDSLGKLRAGLATSPPMRNTVQSHPRVFGYITSPPPLISINLSEQRGRRSADYDSLMDV